MRIPPRLRTFVITLTVLSLAGPAHAQFPDVLKRAAKQAVEDELTSQVDRLLRDAIRCTLDDPRCVQSAEDENRDVIFVDDGGEVITDDEGVPITDRDQAAERAGAGGVPGAGPRPGEGAWANYDFVPGEKVLVYEDYAADNVGDFPRRFDLIQGNWDVIEWQGDRYVRALSGGSLAIPLPETLPEKFTFESAVSLQHGNAYVRVTPGRAYQSRTRTYAGSVASIEFAEAGVMAIRDGPQSMSGHDRAIVQDNVVPFRIMADGEHMKVYLGERRVANVPNAVFPRSDTLFLAVGSATPDHPVLIGPLRIAGGGADLYDRLARDGRVATQGILFDVASDVIRAESTPTLKEIGTMLQEHPDLRISIEGHTDSDGDDAFNRDLSERRAAAVKVYLVEAYRVDASRLETAGFGESKPVSPNDTPEGRQQNRRVELVRR